MLNYTQTIPKNFNFDLQAHDPQSRCWDEFIKYIENEQSAFARVDELNKVDQIQDVISHFGDKKQLVHIGIGGSSLGTKALFQALAPQTNIIFCEGLEDDMQNLFKKINIEDTLFHIVSKSGNTVEVIFQVKQILTYLKQNQIVSSEFKNYFVLTSSQNKSPLYDFACKHELQQLYIPENLGGRFSSLSSVSLFPCLFYGLDIRKILKGAKQFNPNSSHNSNSNMIKEFAESIFSLYQNGIDQNVLMPYNSKLVAFTQWFAQLWAESLGKHIKDNQYVGITPIPSLGSRDQHSLLQLYLHGPLNKFVIFLLDNSIDGDQPHQIVLSALQQGCELALKDIQRPVANIRIDEINEESMGELFQFFHYVCVYLAVQLKINPYDQPAVELAKRHTKSLLNYDLSL